MFERVTKHPGSKKLAALHYRGRPQLPAVMARPPMKRHKGYHGKPGKYTMVKIRGKKGNTWRALTRSLRREPGWKKKMIRRAQERGIL